MKIKMRTLALSLVALVMIFTLVAVNVTTVKACTFSTSTTRQFTQTRVNTTIGPTNIPSVVYFETVSFGFTHVGNLSFSQVVSTTPWNFLGMQGSDRVYSRSNVALFVGSVNNPFCPGRS